MFASKEDYGAPDFDRKATSICGGQLVEMRHQQTPAPFTETLDLPRNAKRLLQQRWWLLRHSIGSKLWFQDGKVMIAGSQRQVWVEVEAMFLFYKKDIILQYILLHPFCVQLLALYC